MRTRYRNLASIVGEWVRRQPRGSLWTVGDCAHAIGAAENAVQYHLERHPEVQRPDPERREYRRERKVEKH